MTGQQVIETIDNASVRVTAERFLRCTATAAGAHDICRALINVAIAALQSVGDVRWAAAVESEGSSEADRNILPSSVVALIRFVVPIVRISQGRQRRATPSA